MALIDLTPPVVPPLQRDVAATSADLTGMYFRLLDKFAGVAMFVWHNPQFTPQQVFDAFGTNAADLVKLSNAFLGFVASYTGLPPESPVPKGWDFKINQDGTVTVVPPPPTPEQPTIDPPNS